MPYVDRNKDGKITGVYSPKQHDGQEFVDDGNKDVAEYLDKQNNIERSKAAPLDLTELQSSTTILGLRSALMKILQRM